MQIEILAYAPTEFFHCQHCEIAWNQVGIGDRFHAEQRTAGLLPPDLMADYTSVSDWALDALERYGSRVSIRLVDVASLEGVLKVLRYRTRHFPAVIIEGERQHGFNKVQLDAALAERLQGAENYCLENQLSSGVSEGC